MDIEALKLAISEKNQEYQEIEKSGNSLLQEVDKLQKEVSLRNSQDEEYTILLESLKEELRVLNIDIENKTQCNKDLENKISIYDRQIQDIVHKIQNSDQKVRLLEEEIQNAKSAIERQYEYIDIVSQIEEDLEKKKLLLLQSDERLQTLNKEVQKMKTKDSDESSTISQEKIKALRNSIEVIENELKQKEDSIAQLESVVIVIKSNQQNYDELKDTAMKIKQENENLLKTIEMKETSLNKEKLLSQAVKDKKMTPQKTNLLEQLSKNSEGLIKTSNTVYDNIDVETSDLVKKQNERIEFLKEQLNKAELRRNERQAALVSHLSLLNSSINSQQQQQKPNKLEGYLEKQGVFIRSWRKRFFFISNNGLYYARSSDNRFDTKGMIDLEGSALIENPVGKDVLSFDIQTQSRVFHLRAFSEPEKERWINGLKEKIEEIEQVLKN